MNQNILKKILAELGKETPSIDYLKGMVETLLEIGENTPVISQTYVPQNPSPVLPLRTEFVSHETTEALPAFLGTGPLGKINNN